MQNVRWIVDFEKWDNARRDEKSAKGIRDYFKTFKLHKGPMFEDELNDLKTVYKSALNQVEDEMDECLSDLVFSMKEFLAVYDKHDALCQRLDALVEKTRKNAQESYEE